MIYIFMSLFVNVFCNGNGIVEVYDIIIGKLVDRYIVYGYVRYQIVFLREGDYLVINNYIDEVLCLFCFVKNYLIREVQNVFYVSGLIFVLFFVFIIWRWGR